MLITRDLITEESILGYAFVKRTPVTEVDKKIMSLDSRALASIGGQENGEQLFITRGNSIILDIIQQKKTPLRRITREQKNIIKNLLQYSLLLASCHLRGVVRCAMEV